VGKILIQKIVFELATKRAFFEESQKAHEYGLELVFWPVFSENNKSVSNLL
jgi:hypothetical protein